MPALDPDHLREYIDVAFPGRNVSPDRRMGLAVRLVDPLHAARRRYVCDDQGGIVAVTWLYKIGYRHLGLVPPRAVSTLDDQGAGVIDEAVAVARDQGARRLELRCPIDEATTALVDACRRTGAREGPGRIEFEAKLKKLPKSKARDELSFAPARDEAEAAAVLARCAVDSPDALPADESASQAVRQMLTRARRTAVLPRVVHLGRLAGSDEAMAFVCAQIDPADKFATITYLALDPRLRGQGLGPVLQRHGFAMLREQGGRRYRGGTSLTNVAMRACFDRNGVPEVARYRMFDWRF